METRSSKRKKDLNPDAENKSKKKQRIMIDTKIDLPDEVLQHIFSFLPIKSIAQTTLLSKYWNHLSLWRTHPHLVCSPLSPNARPNSRLSHKLQSKATEFVPIMLSRRQQDSNIHSFRLIGHSSYSSLLDCLNRVVNHGIEQLELDVYLDFSFTLPPCLFGCKTLKVLILNHRNTGERRSCIVPGHSLPTLDHLRRSFKYLITSEGLPSVHILSLTRVHFERKRKRDRDLDFDLFSGKNFPLLRKLSLKNCTGMTDLYINCPGLETLKLDGLWLTGLAITGNGLLELGITKCFQYVGSWAKILAPSLQILSWESRIPVEFTVESFRDLKTCFLCLHYKTPNRATLRSASNLLSAICFARSIFVERRGSRLLEALSKLDSEGGLPCSFNNLKTLELHTKMTIDEITGTICLLRSSPVLQTITITANSCFDTEKETSNKKQYLISQIQKHKSIEIHLKVSRIDVRGSKMHKSAIYEVI